MPKAHTEILPLLNDQLDPSRVKHREGAHGSQLSYIEGYDAIDAMNEIFGYDGWSRSEPTLTLLWQRPHTVQKKDYNGKVVGEEERIELSYSATLSVTIYWLEGNAIRQTTQGDTGFGTAVDASAMHIEKATKEAVTDALKRCVRALGNQFGNSLYDKQDPNHATNAPTRAPQNTPAPTRRSIV